MSGPYSKRKRYALDVDAWIQFKLLRLAAHHPETTKADLAVMAEVIQQYKGWSGNGFVSDQQICDLTGFNERTVRRARKNLTRLGLVQVVRAGGRGHATVYTPNFTLVPQKADILGRDEKADISVRLTDENVRLNGELPDILTRPSYPESGSLTGPQKDRLDSAPATPPAGAGLTAAPPGAPEEDLSLNALLAAYAPADMSKPARTAYRRAWEAIAAGTDLGVVVNAAADWHQAWAQQNNPDAPRMGLVRWLRDETYLKPAPRGFQKVERKAKAKPGKAAPAGTATIRAVTESGSPFTQLYADIVLTDAAGRETTRRLHVGALGDDGPDVEIYRGLLRAAPNARLAGWSVDANTLAPISPPDVAAPPEPELLPAEPTPTPAPRAKKAKPKIEQREIPSDAEGRKEMLARWRRHGFFDDGVA